DMVPNLPNRPLLLSGHTHGGQVELPWVPNYILKKVPILGHKRGVYSHEHSDVFFTVGTGID
ncbi:phosphohydrolase, partial [Acinetobacter baumannii]